MPEAGVVSAYHIAEQLQFQALNQYFAQSREEFRIEHKSPGILSRKYKNGRVFYFEMGSMVCWGCTPEEEQQLLKELEPFVSGDRSKTTETFAFDYTMEGKVNNVDNGDD